MSGWPRRKRDWVGLRVETTRECRNGYISIPAGAKMTVYSVGTGYLSLEGDGCGCCGVRPFIRFSCLAGQTPGGLRLIGDEGQDGQG